MDLINIDIAGTAMHWLTNTPSVASVASEVNAYKTHTLHFASVSGHNSGGGDETGTNRT